MNINRLAPELILSIATFLSTTDALALLHASRLSWLSHRQRQLVLLLGVVNEQRLRHGVYRLIRLPDSVPEPLGDIFLDLMLKTFVGDDDSGMGLGYCIRHYMFAKMEQMIVCGVRFTHHDRAETRALLTDQNIYSLFNSHDKAGRLRSIIDDDTSPDLKWHLSIIWFLKSEFLWINSCFYIGNLDNCSAIDRDTRVGLLRWVLEHGVDPAHQPNDILMAPLLAIASASSTAQSHGAIHSLLLQAESDPDLVCSSHGMTPLQMAAARAHTDVVVALLAAGADPNHCGSTAALTPLHHVAISNRISAGESARSLVRSGATLNPLDHDGMTPLHYAATRGNHDIVDILCDLGADPCISGPGSFPPMFFAAVHGHISVIQTLIRYGVDPNAHGAGGVVPLQIALDELQFQSAECLLDGGADIDAVDSEGISLLSKAISQSKVEAVQFLVGHGARLTDHHLHSAARIGHTHIVHLVLERVRDPDQVDEMGKTPLMYSSRFGRSAAVKVLVDAGADVDRADDDGFTALFYARAYGNEDVVQILVDHGAKREQIRSGTVRGIAKRLICAGTTLVYQGY